MTCTDARLLSAFRRPGGNDLTAEDVAALDRHLAGCPTCTSTTASDIAFDVAMMRAMTAVPVPTGLKASLHAASGKSIAAARWRRVGRTAAFVVALFAAVGLGLSIYAANRPGLDLEGLAIRHDIDGREKAAKDWLAANNLPTALPYDFDFSLCTFFGKGEIQGQTAPVLVFQDPKNPLGNAQVFLVPDGTFNWKNVPEQRGGSYTTALKIDGGNRAPGFTFVILHTGEIARFLRPIVPAG